MSTERKKVEDEQTEPKGPPEPNEADGGIPDTKTQPEPARQEPGGIPDTKTQP